MLQRLLAHMTRTIANIQLGVLVHRSIFFLVYLAISDYDIIGEKVERTRYQTSVGYFIHQQQDNNFL